MLKLTCLLNTAALFKLVPSAEPKCIYRIHLEYSTMSEEYCEEHAGNVFCTVFTFTQKFKLCHVFKLL